MSTPKDTNPPSPFLTPADLAVRWKVTPMPLRRWRKAGKIKASMLGRGIRFALHEVERVEREAQV